MKTIKVAEATGIVLDYLVAKCDGHEVESLRGGAVWYWLKCSLTGALEVVELFKPSTDWAQGGPIIEREHLSIEAYSAPNDEGIACFWYASEDKFDAETWDGPTPLIAAMRCFVANKLGETAEVPEELG